ncbi:MAG TPA: glycogen synthase GlgA [Kofleriaceae bacterium]|nr:glycogen synthase GlgA [Kofleriaceae bacterium]
MHVASEVTPWSQTGGLGEVVGALPVALAARGGGEVEVSVVTPLYRATRARAAQLGARLEDTGVEVVVAFPAADLAARVIRLVEPPGAVDHFFLDCPPLYDRDGQYGSVNGDYPDNALRFAVLARAALAAAQRVDGGGYPDVFHVHDWHPGLLPLYLARAGRPARSIMTIHNLAFQGSFDKRTVVDLGLDWSAFTPQSMELYDRVSFLKGGLAAADAVTTVSPSYAVEILTPRFGAGLHGFLKYDVQKVHGIRNGIDPSTWNPATDRAIAAPFSARDQAGKSACRAALAAERNLAPTPGELLVGMVSRVTEQKGLDLVADLVPELHGLGVRLVILGSGEPALEQRLLWLAERFSHHLSVSIGFDPPLARRIFAGADCILMPSRFEPCGLTQMYAMRYGAVPIVNPVGGLRDTVSDPGDDALAEGKGTGFCMEEVSASALRAALRRAAGMRRYQQRGWQRLVEHVMTRDFSWDEPADAYLDLYREVLAAAPPAP